MQVYVKMLRVVEVVCRETDRASVKRQVAEMGYRVVADREDRKAGTDLFADDLWYIKGELKLSEDGFANLEDANRG